MHLGHDKWIASKSHHLLQHVSDMRVLILGKPPHLFNRIFKQLWSCAHCITDHG